MLLRPRPGAAGGQLVQVLDYLASNLANVRSTHMAPQRLAAYRGWAAHAIPTLRVVVSAEDLDWLVTTPGYWTLHSAGANGQDQGIGRLLDSEIEQQIGTFEDAQAGLKAELRRWDIGPNGLLVLPDTNVYLHHPDFFNEIDWKQEIRRSAPQLYDGTPGRRLRIVIPLVVIDELDRQKRVGQGHVTDDKNSELTRTRARKTLSHIVTLFEADTTTAVTLQAPVSGSKPVSAALLMDDPQRSRLPIADDEIIDQARALRDLTGCAFIVITADHGMMLRARNADLHAVQLPTEPC